MGTFAAESLGSGGRERDFCRFERKETTTFASATRAPVLLAVPLLFACFSTADMFCAPVSGSPQTRIERDASLVAEGKLHEAETDLREIIKQTPSSFPAYKLLGIVCMREGKHAEAEATLKRATLLAQGKDPETLYYLSQVEFALKKRNEGLKLAMQVTTLEPDNPRALYSVGRLLRENTFSGDAIAILDKAHDLAPSNIAVTTELILAEWDRQSVAQANALLNTMVSSASYDDLIHAGSRFGEVGRTELAIEAFRRAVELRPKAYDGLFNLAFSYYRGHALESALGALDSIPASERDQHGDYHYLRGKIQLALKRVAVAKNEYLLAVEKEPDNESLCTEAGLLFLQSHDFWGALKIFTQCSQALPNSNSVQTGLGLTYFHLGKYNQAIETLKQVLTSDPDADAAREALGFLLYVSGKPSKARSVLERRAQAKDADFYIYYLMALTLLRIDTRGNRTLALDYLEEALRRNPQFAPALFERGRIEFGAAQFNQALDDFQKATELDPDYAEPYALMARAYFKLGDRAKADQAQRRFLITHHEREEKEQERQLQDRLLQSMQ